MQTVLQMPSPPLILCFLPPRTLVGSQAGTETLTAAPGTECLEDCSMKGGEGGSGASFGASLGTTDTATEAIVLNVVGKVSISRLLVGCCLFFFFPRYNKFMIH